jgi:hypothetical protein
MTIKWEAPSEEELAARQPPKPVKKPAASKDTKQ